jgi:hypothetical protein
MTARAVRKVESRADIAAFMAAGKRAQTGNPHWAEPLRYETFRVFDKKRSPLMLENEIQPFVAFRDGQPAGRIVAVVNRRISKNTMIGADTSALSTPSMRDVFSALLDHAAALHSRPRSAAYPRPICCRSIMSPDFSSLASTSLTSCGRTMRLLVIAAIWKRSVCARRWTCLPMFAGSLNRTFPSAWPKSQAGWIVPVTFNPLDSL